DVAHYTPEEKEQIAASYAAHEREARTKGVPTLGSGRIFPVTEEMLASEQADFPNYWPRIGGGGFWWGNPFAGGGIVLGREKKTRSVTKKNPVPEGNPPPSPPGPEQRGAKHPWGRGR